VSEPRKVVVVGAGISGLTSALTVLADSPDPVSVTVLDANDSVGGVIRTTPFAGLPAVDEGADAFLTRVPWAVQLASQLGLGAALTSPTGAHASVWHNGMHSIPGDLLLGVPAKVQSFATSRLISPRGKIRAAIEPMLPRTEPQDSIGHYVRRRFGNEIHERLVDPLVGSIYAADTDNFSLEAVPQLDALTGQRSMLFAAARARKKATQTSDPGAPIFGTPLRGMGALADTVHQRVIALGGKVHTSSRVQSIERHSDSFTVHADGHDLSCDTVIIASPARHSAEFMTSLDKDASRLLAQWNHASVVLITMAIPASQWPAHLTGSGYLVPKPDQRWVTAASFGSNKWAHWRPADGSMIVRVSLGRDGLDVMQFDDDHLVNLALADMKLHTNADFTPTATRISRWPESFPQYRPHHFHRLKSVEESLRASSPGVFFAGASYRGIGIPACVQQARAAGEATLLHLASLSQ
jgi:protoporphyrinogen/coproporphyrinogen III oxidase